jgi:hypothetical protein
MIDAMYCSDQLGRLAGLPGYPKSDAARSGLLDAARSFRSEEQLRQFITDWLRTERRAPLPADLWQAGGQRRGSTELDKPGGYLCTLCYDTGTVLGEVLVTWQGGSKTQRPLTPQQSADLRQKDCEVREAGRTPILNIGTQMIYERQVPCPRCRRNERATTT